MINSIILALSVSIDSFGIGITYGIKNMKIAFLSKSLLFIMSLLFTCASYFIGDFISNIFPSIFTQILSSSILILMGILIIANPIPFDFDHSYAIDLKEAFILGIALSLDSVCVGIGYSIGGLYNFFFPIFVSSFQVIFLSIGTIIGKKISTSVKISESHLKIISGILLITFGIAKRNKDFLNNLIYRKSELNMVIS